MRNAQASGLKNTQLFPQRGKSCSVSGLALLSLGRGTMPARPANGFFCPLAFAESAGENSRADESAYLTGQLQHPHDAVSLHPKPMVEGGRVLARMDGTNAFISYHGNGDAPQAKIFLEIEPGNKIE